MVTINPVFSELDTVKAGEVILELGKMKDFKSDYFTYPIANFYMTDPISRSSKTMAECSRVILHERKVKAA
jgi:NADH-quinone oxidoreductase subunit G